MNRIRAVIRKLERRGPAVPESAEIARLQAEIDELRAEIDELRVDSRRIAELYDLVFERLREQAGTEPKG